MGVVCLFQLSALKFSNFYSGSKCASSCSNNENNKAGNTTSTAPSLLISSSFLQLLHKTVPCPLERLSYLDLSSMRIRKNNKEREMMIVNNKIMVQLASA